MLPSEQPSSDMPRAAHQPAMAAEVIALLCAHRPLRIVDCTAGTGGHAELLLENSPEASCLLAIDRDPYALETVRERLARFGGRAILRQSDYAAIDTVVADAGFEQVDAIVADLGMSSFALDEPSRGFSFSADGPLDMRMDPADEISATEFVNHSDEKELARLIFEYGEERGSRRIARAIVNARREAPITTTGRLASVVARALGGRRTGIHPATRTFQALRIAVNHELVSLGLLLRKAPALLAGGGRFAVLAYHSLEDRAVKERFRELAGDEGFSLTAKKAARPGGDEVASNPRSRSARLRCLERTR